MIFGSILDTGLNLLSTDKIALRFAFLVVPKSSDEKLTISYGFGRFNVMCYTVVFVVREQSFYACM